MPQTLAAVRCYCVRLAGSLLRAILRRILHLPVFRYVDDFYGPTTKEGAESAMRAVARLVRACLGGSSISDDKLGHGNPLVILGVEIECDKEGITCWPAKEKVAKWCDQISNYLKDKKMSAGEASKLSGALQWGGQKAFKRLGRAMLRPIINWSRTRHPEFSDDSEVRVALQWWLEVLTLHIRELRAWNTTRKAPLHMYCDARSVCFSACMHKCYVQRHACQEYAAACGRSALQRGCRHILRHGAVASAHEGIRCSRGRPDYGPRSFINSPWFLLFC